MFDSTAIVEFTRIYLAVFYTGVAVFYAMRITAKKRAGSGEVVFPGARFASTWWNHMLFRAFRMTIWMVCLFRWPFPVVDDYLGIFVALNTWPVVLAGVLWVLIRVVLGPLTLVASGDARRILTRPAKR